MLDNPGEKDTRMNRIVLLAAMALCLAAPALWAQDSEDGRLKVGGFAEYLRLTRADPPLNRVGFGGRAGLKIGSRTQLELEMAFDFKRDFDSPFISGSGSQAVTTHLWSFNTLVGPKFDLGSGPWHPFLTLKGGTLYFNAKNAPPTNFVGNLGKLTSGGRSWALYPAVGIEGFRGRWGWRVEIGDELYYDATVRSNLRVTVGPQFRF
jgi:hypothetical protein